MSSMSLQVWINSFKYRTITHTHVHIENIVTKISKIHSLEFKRVIALLLTSKILIIINPNKIDFKDKARCLNQGKTTCYGN